MAGAAQIMAEAGIEVFAAEDRGPNATLQLMQNRADRATADVVVIQVGTNGPVSVAQYDAMAQLLIDVPQVFFMTVKAPLDWIAANNALIRALPDRYPNVAVIDWEQFGSSIESELSPGDGYVHLYTPRSITLYSNLVLDAVGLPPVSVAGE